MACPACGSVTLARVGAGSERIEALLAAAVAPLPVFRLDSDSGTVPGGHLGTLAAFPGADAGVLVGTQMVAKGHDFPDVVLAVVLDADATLRFPDFRAEERTFALVAQLAGRSGRGDAWRAGARPDADPGAAAIRYAAAHDSHGFLAPELVRRRELAYPPFAHLVRVELTCVDGGRVDAAPAASDRASTRSCRRRPGARTGAAVSPRGAASAANSWSRRPSAPPRLRRSAGDRHRGSASASCRSSRSRVDVDPP